MKVKLWQVQFQYKKYLGEHPEFTVNAPDIIQAINKVLLKGKGEEGCTLKEIITVDWVATED